MKSKRINVGSKIRQRMSAKMFTHLPPFWTKTGNTIESVVCWYKDWVRRSSMSRKSKGIDRFQNVVNEERGSVPQTEEDANDPKAGTVKMTEIHRELDG